MNKLKKMLKILAWCALAVIVLFILLSFGRDPERIAYGVSYSKFYSEELGLPWKDVLISALDELKVKKLRLMAYWPMIEPERGTYDFTDLDFQMNETRARNAEVVLAVGRRLPRWPECHIPGWAKALSWEEQKIALREYITAVVERYRSYENLLYWQVENEPFLTVFAWEHCGDLDKDFLDEEIALVKQLDPDRPILVTDSGNLGLWYGAWNAGDTFGTSVYMYLWNPQVGEVKSFYLPSFYKVKKNLLTIVGGKKKSLLIELSLEPWLLDSVTRVPLDTQLDRMGIDKMNEVLGFAEKTGFEEQYLWGVEWWYYMKEKGHPEYIEKAKEIFSEK